MRDSSRIFITGDTHRDIDISKLNTNKWKEQRELSRSDILIVTGDFGVPWTYGEDNTDKYILKWYEKKSFTVLFVDGNHDNEDAIKEYSVVDFLGARCHKIRENVFHVMRGEVLNVGEHKILCMGGAMSVDKYMRIPHVSWWPDEEASFREWQHCYDSLRTEKPDVIVSHDAPGTVITEMVAKYAGNRLLTMTSKNFDMILDEIAKNGSCVKDWFFGHHHIDKDSEIGGIRYHALYQRIEEL